MKKYLLLFTFLYLCFTTSFGQLFDISTQQNIKKIDIPFEYENNFIIVKVLFNDVFPLKFIFDTGAEHTILTKREITDLLQVNYDRRFTLKGSDLTTDLYAYLATGVKLSIHNMIAMNRAILVLEEDYFRFEEYGGINVQGIIGADLFRRFVVKIDYRRKMISLYDPAKFEIPKGKYEEVPVQITRNKPYIIAQTTLTQDTTIAAKYLIDTGASLSLLIYTNSHPAFDLPPNYIRSKIGMGLGGYLQGFLGRIDDMEIGPYKLPGVITNFQDIPAEIDSSFLNNRNGIIGNQILNRFEIIIDYIHEKMYVKPGRNFRKKFEYDKSGLILAASGQSLNVFTVVDIITNSPAAEAGMQIGDEIKRINNVPAGLLSLSDLTRKLRKRPGKKIKILVLRGEERLKFSFKLRRLL